MDAPKEVAIWSGYAGTVLAWIGTAPDWGDTGTAAFLPHKVAIVACSAVALATLLASAVTKRWRNPLTVSAPLISLTAYFTTGYVFQATGTHGAHIAQPGNVPGGVWITLGGASLLVAASCANLAQLGKETR